MPAAPIILSGFAVSGLSATIGTALAGIVGATISTAAATAIGTGAIAGLATAVRGGSVSDVLKSAVLNGVSSYAGAQVGNFVGSQVSSAVGGKVGAIASKVLSNVATGVTESVIKGQDISKGALFGLAQGAVGSLDIALKDNSAWQSLGKVGQAAIKAATAASITGQDVKQSALTAAIEASGIISKAINISPEFKKFLDDPNKSAAAQIALGAVTNTISSVLTGRDFSDAAKDGILKSTGQYLGKLAKTGLEDYVKSAQEKYSSATKVQEQIESNVV